MCATLTYVPLLLPRVSCLLSHRLTSHRLTSHRLTLSHLLRNAFKRW